MRRRALPAAEAARAVGVPVRTIRRWVTEGRLTRYGTKHRLLVQPLEAAELAALRRDTPSGRRLRRRP